MPSPIKNISRKKLTIAGRLLLLLVFTPIFLQAQQPFQDGKGAGTIFTNTGGYIQVNLADPSIRLGYTYDPKDSDWIFGANVGGKLTGNSLSIISNNNIAPNAQFDLTVGRRFRFSDNLKARPNAVLLEGLRRILRKKGLLSKGAKLPSINEFKSSKNASSLKDLTLNDYLSELDKFCGQGRLTGNICLPGKILNAGGTQSLLTSDDDDINELKPFGSFSGLAFQGGYTFQQYNLFTPTAPFASQLSKKDFHSASAKIIYNQQIQGNKMFGASVGVEKGNNSEDLTTVDIRDFISTSSGSNIREFGRTRKALLGDFKQFTRTFVNTDLAWFPGALKNRIGVDFFTRSGLTGDSKGIRSGVGIFFSEEGNPTHVIGGVSVFTDNHGKLGVALTAGYNF